MPAGDTFPGMSEEVLRADVAVVGAGIAGLVATLELLEHGRSVVLLDRCRPEELGGLAREAFGGMFMVDTPEQRRSGVHDSYELALADWLRIADFDAEDVWPRRWAEHYVARARDEVGGWLRQHGVSFFPVVNWAERGVFGDGNSVPRFHLAWGTGKALVDAVWGSIERHPRRSALNLRLRARVTALTKEAGCVTGCRVAHEDAFDDAQKERAEEILREGTFTLEDFLDQLARSPSAPVPPTGPVPSTGPEEDGSARP